MYEVLVADPNGVLYTDNRPALAKPAFIADVSMIENYFPLDGMTVRVFLSDSDRLDWWFESGENHGFSNGRLIRTWDKKVWAYNIGDFVDFTNLVRANGGARITVMKARDLYPLPNGYHEFVYRHGRIDYVMRIEDTMDTLLKNRDEGEDSE